MIRFELPIKLETGNAIRGWDRSPSGKGWAIYGRYKESLMKQILAAAPNHCNRGRPRAKKRVIIKYFTKIFMDKDNLYAAMKPFLDAIVELELIKDDSPKWCELHVSQGKLEPRQYKVVVEIH